LNSIKITKLPNGIRVATEKINHVNSFSLGFWFNVGSRDEILKTNGISHFLEHMFFKGTKTRSARKISEEIESLGGYLNAFTSKEHTCFYGRGLNKYLKKTFLVLSDMIQNSEDIDEEDKINLIIPKKTISISKGSIEKALTESIVPREIHWQILIMAMRSIADTVIFAMQDALGLDQSHRMNLPSTTQRNWQWRVLEEQLDSQMAKTLLELTRSSDRL